MAQTIDLEKWTNEPDYKPDYLEHQDRDWCIASDYSSKQIITTYENSNKKNNRINSLLHALIIQLECLLDPDEPCQQSEAENKKTLLSFLYFSWNIGTKLSNLKRISALTSTLSWYHI